MFPSRERDIMRPMRVIAKRTLRAFWEKCEDAKEPLEAWHHEVLRRAWKTPNEVKKQFRNASILKGGRAVFNIAGNKYRLVVAIDYVLQVVFVKFIGTHAQYDQINAETV